MTHPTPLCVQLACSTHASLTHRGAMCGHSSQSALKLPTLSPLKLSSFRALNPQPSCVSAALNAQPS